MLHKADGVPPKHHPPPYSNTAKAFGPHKSRASKAIIQFLHEENYDTDIDHLEHISIMGSTRDYCGEITCG